MEEQIKDMPEFIDNDHTYKLSDTSTINTQNLLRETAHLKELVLSHVKRIDNAVVVAHDDLTRVPTEVQRTVGSSERLYDEKFNSIKELLDLHVSHITQISSLKSIHQQELDNKESARIDAIRQIDQLNRTTEAERSATAVSALATANSATAETLRTTVANSANTLAGTFEKTVNSIVDRLANLEKSSYLGAGRAAVSDPTIEKMAQSIDALLNSQAKGAAKTEVTDPQITNLLSEVKNLTLMQSQGKGRSEGYEKFLGWIIAAMAIIGFIIANFIKK